MREESICCRLQRLLGLKRAKGACEGEQYRGREGLLVEGWQEVAHSYKIARMHSNIKKQQSAKVLSQRTQNIIEGNFSGLKFLHSGRKMNTTVMEKLALDFLLLKFSNDQSWKHDSYFCRQVLNSASKLVPSFPSSHV